MLTKWRDNVYKFLSKEDASASIQRKHMPLVEAAYAFLDTHGFINFGVAPSMAVQPNAPELASQDKKTVVVIGAGLAGAPGAEAQHQTQQKLLLLRHLSTGRVFILDASLSYIWA